MRKIITQNKKTVLNAICFIEQGKNNIIDKINIDQHIVSLIKEVYLSTDSSSINHIFNCLDILIQNVSFYKLTCDISQNAVKSSFEALTQLSFNDSKIDK